MDISDRAVIITGGTGAIGLGVARRWLAEGADVLLVASSQESIDSAVDALGPSRKLHGFAGDVASEAGVGTMAAAAREAFGRPADTLVHLVGGFAMSPIDAPDAGAVWDRMIALNLTSAFHCYRAAIAGFRETGRGWIVGIASRAALQPPARAAAYAASKAGLIAFTRSLAAETLRSGIHVNAIVTSTVDTPANRIAMGDKKASDWVSVDDIADATIFLCSDAARSISSATLEVHGKA